MPNKDIIRSMRFTQETYQLIDSQPGDNFSEKFNYLVHICVDALPDAQLQLSDVRKQIANERSALRVLREQKAVLAQNVNSVNYALKAFISTVERANTNIENSGVLL